MSIRTLSVFMASAALAGAAGLGAQEQSAAEAARRAREQKKPAAQKVRVWTNDNIPTRPGAVSVLGTAAAAPAPAAEGAPGAPARPALSPEDAEARGELKQQLEQARQQLQRAEAQVALEQRDLDLYRQQFFSNPNYAADRAGRARLDQMEASLRARQEEAERARANLQRLEAEMQELEERIGPQPEEPPSPEQQQAEWRQRARALREELAGVEGQMQRIREDLAARGLTMEGALRSGSPTADLYAQLEARRRDIQARIAALEDEARRAGVPAAWLR